jgi:hypothetical protein
LTFLYDKGKNTLRKTFGFNIYPEEIYSTNKATNNEFEERIGFAYTKALEEYASQISIPSESLLIELYAHYSTYWNYVLKKLSNQSIDPDFYLEKVVEFARFNAKNPNLSCLFLDAHKEMAKMNPSVSLLLFAYYMKFDISSESPLNREMLQNSEKIIYQSQTDYESYGAIFAQLKSDGDLNWAIEQIIGLN